MEAYVIRTLKKISAECTRKHRDLRTLCDDQVLKLQQILDKRQKSQEQDEEINEKEYERDQDFGKYIAPFLLATKTKYPRLMEISLDGLNYMIEHGYVKGYSDSILNEDQSSQSLIDTVIRIVYECRKESDEGVQRQVIKCMLTAVSVTSAAHPETHSHEVHDATLINAMKALLFINLISKFQTIKVTSKAALTQMINIVNNKMENEAKRLALLEPKHDSSAVEVSSSVPFSAEKEPEADPTDTNDDNSSSTSLDSASKNKKTYHFPSIYHQDAHKIFRYLCSLSKQGINEQEDEDSNFLDILQIGGNGDSAALQYKILSLELLLSLLQNSSVEFRSNEKFIYTIRNNLCVSLLNNCTSNIASVVGISLQIFLFLIKNLKIHLKSELEVFINTIFLKILESENSTYEHKVKVLEVFQHLCEDPQNMIELFINYDCDLEASNLFSKIVVALSKIAKNPPVSTSRSIVNVDFMNSSGKRTQQEEVLQLRSMGLEGLTMILKSLMTASNLSCDKEKDVTATSVLPTNSEESSTSTTDISIQVNEPADSNSALPSNIVETFDKKLKLQKEIDTGILKFAHSPIQSLRYFHSLGHLTWDPKSVALFLIKYQDKLDKTQLGEFLGREKEYENGFAYKVLHEYVEALDFSTLKFDIAIRHFLYGFRLPGEAQKIDRIMEKFAERYYIQHQDEFANADMAFILAFSTIMLQTNLHNPAIKEEKKMNKEQFVKQNKGISSDGELSDDLLMEIYDRIAAEPISMNDGKTPSSANANNPNPNPNSAPFVVFQSMNDKKKKDAFNNEIKEMVRAGEAMIKLSTKRRTSTAYITHNINSSSSVTTPIHSPTNSQSDSVSTSSTVNVHEDNTYLIKPMFESVWPPVIGVLSQTLETSDEPKLVTFCIQAFKDCIFLACRLDFTVARNTFINALAKFTTLDVVKEMKIKNILCIKLLLQIAFSEGEYLEKSWSQVLQCISLLSRLQLFSTGSHTDDMFFSSSDRLSDPNSSKKNIRSDLRTSTTPINTSQANANASILPDPISKFFSGMGIGSAPVVNAAAQQKSSELIRQIEEANAELITQSIDMVMIDKLFLKSTSLSPAAVLHFVRALCEVSLLEISSGSSMNMKNRSAGTSVFNSNIDHLTEIGPITVGSGFSPRTFSLQKLVEVADFNMNVRSRYDWSLIWKLLTTQFSSVGLSDNISLAMFAIDSLKQLSIKFLQKDELSNFNFQKIFLHPFEIIITKSNNTTIKDLVLGCIDIMIKTCSQNIRSGWKTIFSILSQAAQDEDEKVATEGMIMVERMMENQFTFLIDHDFVDLMNCLVSFAKSKYTNLSLKALNFLAKCADHLVESESSGSNLSLSSTNATSNESENHVEQSEQNVVTSTFDNEESRVFKYWWPLLLGLATRGSDSRKDVRVTAVKVLGEVLRSKGSGSGFSLPTWSMVFKGVLYPMVDAAKLDDLVLGMNVNGSKTSSDNQVTSNYHYNTQTNTIISTPGAPSSTSSSTLNASQLHWVSNEVRSQREFLSSATRSKREWVDSMARDVLALCLELYLARREEITNMKLVSTQQSTLDNESALTVDIERESELLPDLLTFLQGCICQDLESLSVMALQVTRTLLHSLSSPIYLPKTSPKGSPSKPSNLSTEVLNNNNLSQNHFELRVLPKSHTNLVIKRFTESLWANLCFEFVGGLGKISLDSYPCPNEIKEKAKSHPFLSRWQGVGGEDEIIRGSSSNDLESLNNAVSTPSYSAQDLALILTRLALTQTSCYRVTLALPLILTRFALTHSASLTLEHWQDLLMALEATHWQAYALNENLPLRHRLSQCGIMKRNNKVKKVVVMKKMMMSGTPSTNLATPQTTNSITVPNSISNSPNIFEDHDDWWLPEVEKDVFDETGNDFLDDYQDDDESDDEDDEDLSTKPKAKANLSIDNNEYLNHLPDVLQQEVQVLHLLLQVIFYLYFEKHNEQLAVIDFPTLVQQHPEYSVRSHNVNESREFVYQYYKRIITLLIERFCSIELILFPIQANEFNGASAHDLNLNSEKVSEGVPSFDDEESDDSEEDSSSSKTSKKNSHKSQSGINSVIVDNVFLSKRYLAYERVLVFTLTQLLSITNEDLDLKTREWLVPLLNRLILTSSRPVRIVLLRLFNSLFLPILLQ